MGISKGNWFENQAEIDSKIQNISADGSTFEGIIARQLYVPGFSGRQGATATVGWVVTGVNKGLATLAESATADTLVIPITGLCVGDTIEDFTVVGQIESAGGSVTVDADLRKVTNAAAGGTDASLGTITQVTATADKAFSQGKTLATAEEVDGSATYYLLVTATTAASTDVELSGVILNIT